jgi:hypothetical protein
MNDKELKKLHEEIRREAMSSTRMVGLVILTSIIGFITIFFLASCGGVR